jgi:hypothetical protein
MGCIGQYRWTLTCVLAEGRTMSRARSLDAPIARRAYNPALALGTDVLWTATATRLTRRVVVGMNAIVRRYRYRISTTSVNGSEAWPFAAVLCVRRRDHVAAAPGRLTTARCAVW